MYRDAHTEAHVHTIIKKKDAYAQYLFCKHLFEVHQSLHILPSVHFFSMDLSKKRILYKNAIICDLYFLNSYSTNCIFIQTQTASFIVAQMNGTD